MIKCIIQFFITWWFLDTVLRGHNAVRDDEVGICMRIGRIGWVNAVTCVRIVFDINIGVYPYWGEIFKNTIDHKFFDEDLNSIHERFLSVGSLYVLIICQFKKIQIFQIIRTKHFINF